MDSEVIHEIIKLYENHRILWNSKYPAYYNKSKREDEWREISAIVNIPVKELKKKMTSLLGSYRREKSREKRSRVSGSGTKRVYKSQWFAYQWFQFLADKDISNDTTLTVDNGNNKSSTTSSSSAVGSELQPTKKRRSSPTNVKASNEILLDAYAVLKNSSSTPSDHYESFGNHVASELRKYDSRTLPYVKRAILDVLFQADIGELTTSHNAQTAKCYSNSSASSIDEVKD